ncbi:hypothetical protein CPB83DRAFT_172646 [Crepidotus variabilis]|uniref:Uncharacterized protein n=1 Tax=Crepidotus variabilis TaxID=179855 RepID=A0A9P6JI38_9AGAR|nr:hypothetical protein CPB83DRAFT_172646 [Crepidotus variabilis]
MSLRLGASMIVNFPEAFIHLPKTFRVVLRHMFKGQKSFLNESEKGRKKIEALGTSTIYVFVLICCFFRGSTDRFTLVC